MTTTIATVSVTLMIIIPVGLAVALRRRFSVPWWLFCVGMATFAGSQLLHLPLNNLLKDLGLIGQVSQGSSDILRTSIILGLSAGVSETLARAVGYWLIWRRAQINNTSRRRSLRWESGIMIGLGHGGIEAMGLVGVVTAASLSSLLALSSVDLTTLNLAADQMVHLSRQLEQIAASPWLMLVPLLERVLAIVLHVMLSLMVWTAFKRRNVFYLAAAAAYHSTVDAALVYASTKVENPWLLESLIFLALLPGLLWVWRSRPGDLSKSETPRYASEQLYLLSTAIRKELLQQWRTKRVLVVLAIFVLFGLGSPLLAKFTPEMLRGIEGAEQFAELIPIPTNVDAMNQYVKNLTQFGFVIAVLIGMGAVAGEKERGTTAMILSKPMPRWAFVISKFSAQAAIYALGFAAASLCAFYYTLVLFEPFAFWPFMFANVLMLLWLLVFSAVTLLGSTLTSSTGAAAGTAFLMSVFLMMAGSLPKIGLFFPSGLITWASQMGLGITAPANGGALVANVVIIVVCLITSIAVFETQEL